MWILFGVCVGALINHFVIRPLEAKKIQKELRAQGYPTGETIAR